MFWKMSGISNLTIEKYIDEGEDDDFFVAKF